MSRPLPPGWHRHEIASRVEEGDCSACGSPDYIGDRVLCREDGTRACDTTCVRAIEDRDVYAGKGVR